MTNRTHLQRSPWAPALRGIFWGLVAATALALGLAGASPAWADDVEEQLEYSLHQSEEYYETLDLEMAGQTLVEAIELAEGQGYTGRIVANLYLMLGVVESALTDESAVILDYFVAGLTHDRTAELNPYYATPSLRDILAEARSLVPETRQEPDHTGEPEDGRPPQTAGGNVLEHTPVATVQAGEPVAVIASIGDPDSVDRVVLSYRAEGSRRYERRDLVQARGGDYYGEIPGELTEEGIQVEYYLEALGRSNEQVAESGNSARPHAVIIVHEGGATPGSRRIMTICAGPGTGGGLATGEPLTMGSQVDLNPGVALTPLHFYMDATFALGAGLELGPFTRIQTVLLTSGVELEVILGGKLKWFFINGEPLRMYLSFGGGWGNVRHTVDLKPTVDFVDTTREGPYHGGIGFGTAYMFNKYVGLVADLYSMVLFDQVSVQLDLNVGILVSF